MIMTIFVFLGVVVVLYAIIYCWTKGDIDGELQYNENLSPRQNIINNNLIIYLQKKYKTIVVLGALAWPLYYMFIIGAALGAKIYDILIEDDYENRIASWFI